MQPLAVDFKDAVNLDKASQRQRIGADGKPGMAPGIAKCLNHQI
jgi:hypothetical protein